MPTPMHRAILHLGSNLGDRLSNLRQALAALDPGLGTIESISHLYETEAWGNTDQPDFINLALSLTTPLSPPALMTALLGIETGIGRIRGDKWAARSIDIDILFFEDWVVEEPGLQIPHPRLHERNFVLVPLLELFPDLCHPVLLETIEDLYWQSTDPLEVIQMEEKIIDPESKPA